MALFKQTIYQNKVNEINKAGKHLKVINSQTELDIRVFNLVGELILSTKVRAGFEITLPVFAKVVISAEQEQKIEMWVDENPLGYNAPTANANDLKSFKGLHYGDSEEILPFEPSRLSAKIVSDSPWWYGGSNVDSENGIPVAAGEVAEIRGAAKISAAISAKAEYLTTTQTSDTGARPWIYGSFSNAHGVVIQNNSGGIDLLNKSGLQSVPTQGVSVYVMAKISKHVIAYAAATSDYIYLYNMETKKVELLSIPTTTGDAVEGKYITRISSIAYTGGRYVINASVYDMVAGKDIKALVVSDDSGWLFKYVMPSNSGHYPGDLYPISDSGLLILHSDKVYCVDVNAIPDDRVYDGAFTNLNLISTGFSGDVGYLSVVSYGGYTLLKSQSTNSEAVLIKESDFTAVNIGRCQIALLSEVGLIKGNGSDWLLSKDFGQTYTPIEPALSFSSSSNVHADFYDGVVIIASTSLTGYILTEKQRQNAKQNFRILKAYS
ncbi:hypothetical protein [Pseudoalteromonas phage GXT1010]|nr:hypothetical protein [Pseudoalteromonas phage GXT1010]